MENNTAPPTPLQLNRTIRERVRALRAAVVAKGREMSETIRCPRCSGMGYVVEFETICLECNGTGRHPISTAEARETLKLAMTHPPTDDEPDTDDGITMPEEE